MKSRNKSRKDQLIKLREKPGNWQKSFNYTRIFQRLQKIWHKKFSEKNEEKIRKNLRLEDQVASDTVQWEFTQLKLFFEKLRNNIYLNLHDARALRADTVVQPCGTVRKNLEERQVGTRIWFAGYGIRCRVLDI